MEYDVSHDVTHDGGLVVSVSVDEWESCVDIIIRVVNGKPVVVAKG